MPDLRNTLPDVSFSVGDGGLGRTPALGIGNTVLIGTSTIPTDKPLRIRNKKDALKLGEGVLTEEVMDLCDVATPPQLYAYSITPDVLLKPQSKVEGSTDAAKLPTMAGESQIAWEATFIVTLDGGPNVATFTYTLNGESKGEQTIPTSKQFVIGSTGVTITFKDNYTAGDSFTIYTEGTPELSDAKYLEAIEEVTKFRLDVEFITLVNPASKVVLAGFASLLEELAINPHHYFLWGLACREGLIASGGDIDNYLATLEEEIKTYRCKRLAVVAMEARVLSGAEEKVKVPIGTLAGFISTKNVAQGLNEFSNSALPNFTGIYPENLDQSVQVDLMKMGYICFRAVHNLDGVFIADPRTTMENTSDFYRIERIRVMNKACIKVRVAMLPFINSTLMVNKQGQLLNVGIIRITAGTALLEMQRAGDISEGRVTIDEYQDVLSSEVLEVDIKIIPLGYLKYPSIRMNYENPNFVMGA